MTPDALLGGRVALVTGASRGIGRAAAIALAQAGADIVVHYRRQKGPAHVVARKLRSAGAEVSVVGGDLRERSTARELVQYALDWKGRLDIVVANAGISEPGSMTSANREAWTRTLETNLIAPFELAQAARVPLRRAKGTFISTASTSGLVPSPQEIPYNASKAGLVMVTRCLALALAPEVRVNAVAPGWVVTDMTRATREDRNMYRSVRATTPLGRWGKPEDIGAAIVFLASDMARFVTGQVLVVDGGQSLYWRVKDVPA